MSNDVLLSIEKEICEAVRKIDHEEIMSVINEIESANRVFVYGVGRSGLMAKAFTMRLMHLGITAFFADETSTPSAGEGDFLIVCSGSGETGCVKAMAIKAKNLGLKIGLLTIDECSSIGNIADVLIEIPSFTPKRQSCVQSIQPMGSLFEQLLLIVLDAMILELKIKMGVEEQDMFTRHKNLE